MRYSEADSALCCILAFWTRNPHRIDRIFRRSGLMRRKWDEQHAANGETYGELTIPRALETVSKFWQGQSSASGNGAEAASEEAGACPIPPPQPDPAPLGDAAYYGVLGDIVKAIEPHTEADERRPSVRGADPPKPSGIEWHAELARRCKWQRRCRRASHLAPPGRWSGGSFV